MSCRCAVLVSDTAGPQEIVAEGTGLKIALTNPEQYVSDYAAALVRLAGDAPLRRQLGERAREHILQHHDWPRIGQHLLDLCHQLGSQLDTPPHRP
jgi:glycosyltransferase involved in cell wall biosynthesis